MTRLLTSIATALVVASSLYAASASAGVIVSAASVTASNSNPDPIFGNANNLINQGGLATPYTSGVTDFNTYIASNPQHTVAAEGAEWFTDAFLSSVTLTFNLGSMLTIGGLAVWVDEFWGAGIIEVLASLDDSTYTSLGSFAPTDWALTVPSYGADVFSFAATSAQFVRLSLSGCPQPQSEFGGGCGLGEVAFNSVAATVPEPGSLALVGLALAGLAASRRKRIV